MTSHDCLTISFHYVRDAAGPFGRLNALGPIDFATQIDRLAQTRAILDASRFLAALRGEHALERPSALLTFDDGLVDHYETVFPALQRRGLRGVFFISTSGNGIEPRVMNVQRTQLLLARLGGARLFEEAGALAADAGFVRPSAPPHPALYRYDTPADREAKRLLNYELPYELVDHVLSTLFARHVGGEEAAARGLYLNEGMIREMSHAGMTFGFHTRNHRVLSRLSADEQRLEVECGVRWIRELTGQHDVPFCYPHGHAHAYTPTTIAILQEAGYAMAFTAIRGVTIPGVSSAFELPRYDTCDVSADLCSPSNL